MIAYGREPDALDPWRDPADEWQPATARDHAVFYTALAIAALP